MKTKILTSVQFTILIASLFFLFSCHKSNDSQNTASTFTWTWNGTTYNGNFQEAFLQSMSTTPIIMSGTGSSILSLGSGPRISVTSFAVGSYNLGSGIPYYISFVATNGDILQSTSGNLTITSNSNNKMNGNFSATLINSTNQTSTITGSFTNLTISQ